MAEWQRTFIMVKPDGVQRGLVGEVISRFERRGLRLAALRMMIIDRELARQHYAAHEGKAFFAELVNYITSAPVVAMVWEGPGAIALARAMMGPTNAAQAPGGTLRGDYCVDIGFNLVHGSDGPEAAAREIGLFFAEAELCCYARDLEKWVMPRP
ncbi:MAG: nucleoside-diphosphate kinase [Bacillota bacterium]